ncbi:hypothetical protein KUTeg_007880 [Tegillarca granosa]|uniref:Fibronectin type-III domain-containing protein n=1 Tax=Tegillarca granosa TaxID=220873 RepID=A0ABQ9FHG9_TEGGR|nr:hypothetical protein KUTeg_007880 [Tegillarca granosa]
MVYVERWILFLILHAKIFIERKSRSINKGNVSESALGGSCMSGIYCDGSNVECFNNKCQCEANFYDDNNAVGGGTCKPINELKVKNVTVSPAGTNSSSVTWTNPAANSAIESKQVRWTGTTSGSDTVAVGDISTTITGLTSGGTYSITVVSIDTNSRNMQQEVSTTAVSVTIKPALPGEIKTNNPDTTGTQVTLSWIASVGEVTYYNVVFDGGNGDTKSQNTANNINSITMKSLTPGRRYNITITAISGSMTSDPRYGNTRTTVTVPEAPTNLRCISVMDTNVTLEWTPPINPNGDIMYYLITVTFGPGSPRTVNTTKPVQTQEIDKLTEDSDYSFTVRARNDLYDGPVSSNATCKTKPGLPSKPQNLSTVTVQSRSLTVGWMKPNATKGSLIGYRIIVQNGTTCSKEILYQCSNCEKKPNLTSSCSMNSKTMVAITDTGLTNESFVQTIEGLSPYVSYSVLVHAITGAGDGYSGAVTVETNEEAPQNLTQVSADVLNSTAIKLSWSIPDPRPGKTTYTIYLYDVINEKQALNKSIEVLGFYKRSTILTNLEEYWQYVINIKASTNKGQSAMKTVKPDKTKPAAPGKVANFMVSRPEGDYKLATVTWSIPSLRDQNSLITSYEFKHNATGTPASKILSQSVNNGDGFTESIEVQPENYYYIEVYAINNLNQTGVKSSELYYAPPGPPPKLDSSPDIKVIQNDIKSPSTETTATILLYQNQFTANENGQIINNGIILCPKETQITTQRQYTDYDQFTTWNEAKKDEFRPVLQTNQ